MIIPRIDNGIFVVGLSEGPVTESVVKALSSQDVSVRVYLPEEAAQFLAAVAAHHYPLPLVVEPGYDMNSIRVLLVSALRHGVRLVPVGSQALWEQMVPLEMPELIELRVIAPEELKVQEVDETSEPEDEKEAPWDTSSEMYVVNGTTVCTLFPSLRQSLADLSSRDGVAETAALSASTSVPSVKIPADSKRTKRNNHTLEKILLSAVLAVCVAGIACYLIMISSDDFGAPQTQATPAVPASSAVSASPPVSEPVTPKQEPGCKNPKDIEAITECANSGCKLCKEKKKHHDEVHVEGSTPTEDQLKDGINRLGCSFCMLEDHKNKAHQDECASVSQENYERGINLKCELCKKIEHRNKYHGENPQVITAEAREAGVKLNCLDCLAAEHKKKHDKAVWLEKNDIEEGVTVGCKQCEEMKKHEREHAEWLKKTDAERKAFVKAGKDRGCPECGKISDDLLKHLEKCHPVGRTSPELSQKEVEAGEKLGCTACIKQAKLSKHKCPTDLNDMSLFEEGRDMGCEKCKAVLEAHQKVKAARKALEEAQKAKAAADEAQRKAKEAKAAAEKAKSEVDQKVGAATADPNAQAEAEKAYAAVKNAEVALNDANGDADRTAAAVAAAQTALNEAETELQKLLPPKKNAKKK